MEGWGSVRGGGEVKEHRNGVRGKDDGTREDAHARTHTQTHTLPTSLITTLRKQPCVCMCTCVCAYVRDVQQ